MCKVSKQYIIELELKLSAIKERIANANNEQETTSEYGKGWQDAVDFIKGGLI